MSSDIDVQITRNNQCLIKYDATRIKMPDAAMVKTWTSLAGSAGRGKACVYEDEESDHILVFKHYFRGGFMARFNRDHYFGFKAQNCRSWREFNLLNVMRRMNLPVPNPVVAVFSRSGLTYRADLITEYIKHTDTLAGHMPSGVADILWQSVGLCIRRFHDCGVEHADLNAMNILVRDNEIALIDFDKSRIRQDYLNPASLWKRNNLRRLQRSLYKIRNNNSICSFNNRQWAILVKAYNTPNC